MKPSSTIKFKALFLLVSFSLNTVVGFACSLGLNPHRHHHDEEESHSHKHHEHASAQSHQHNKGTHEHHHNHEKEEQHNKTQAFYVKAFEDDRCCTSSVVGFQNLDKQLAQKNDPVSQKITFALFAFPTPIILHNQVDTKPLRTPQKIRDHSPPDIRVFIQSFQI